MKRPGVLNIAIANKHRTSIDEAGTLELHAAEGAKIVALTNWSWPDHDRQAAEQVVFPMLREQKPDIIILLGGMIHDDPFQELAPRKDPNRKVAIYTHKATPEFLAAIEGQESFEERAWAYGKYAGANFIRRLGEEAGGAKVFYIPATTGTSNENEIMTFLYYTKKRIDEWNERHSKGEEVIEPQYLPTHSEEFAALLGLENDDLVTVLPFGSSILLNDHIEFVCGDFKRREPITAGKVEVMQRGRSIVRGNHGKLADGWFTTAEQTLTNGRKYWSFHEVPNLVDFQRTGYRGDYDRIAKGFYYGSIVGGQLHGCSFPLVPGKDGRRSVVVNGVAYTEETAGGLGRQNGKVSIARRAR